MRTCLCLMMMLVVPWLDDKPKEKEDVDQFQGTWTVSLVEINGQKQSQLSSIKVTFEGDKISTTVGKNKPEPKGTFKLDPKREPIKGYEVTTPEGVVVKGIYELDGDTLKFCLSGPDKEPPTAFETKPDDNRTLLVYKRREKSTKAK